MGGDGDLLFVGDEFIFKIILVRLDLFLTSLGLVTFLYRERHNIVEKNRETAEFTK
jgi:hypothetical protein